jgi:hypothetical protein
MRTGFTAVVVCAVLAGIAKSASPVTSDETSIAQSCNVVPLLACTVVKAEQMIVDVQHADVYLTGTRVAHRQNEQESYRQGTHGPVHRRSSKCYFNECADVVEAEYRVRRQPLAGFHDH